MTYPGHNASSSHGARIIALVWLRCSVCFTTIWNPSCLPGLSSFSGFGAGTMERRMLGIAFLPTKPSAMSFRLNAQRKQLSIDPIQGHVISAFSPPIARVFCHFQIYCRRIRTWRDLGYPRADGRVCGYRMGSTCLLEEWPWRLAVLGLPIRLGYTCLATWGTNTPSCSVSTDATGPPSTASSSRS